MKRRDGSLITHRRLMSSLTAHFNSIATIGELVIIYDSFNQPIGTEFVVSDIPELTNIRCYKEPLGDRTASEVGKPNQIVISDKLVVALDGYFPQIRTADYVRINERIYNITGVASDDTDTITFLNVVVVNAPVEEMVL